MISFNLMRNMEPIELCPEINSLKKLAHMPNFRLSRARISHERIDQMSFNLLLSVLSNVQIIIKKKREEIL